jgi:uncharacterized protein YcbX
MTTATRLGTVAAIGRYPVKSMLGEQPNEVYLDARGMLGDRAFALIDADTGTVLSMKHPRTLGRTLECRAAFCLPPTPGAPLPPAAVTFPDGRTLDTGDAALLPALRGLLGRDVTLVQGAPAGAAAETLWPDIEGLSYRDQVRTSPLGRYVPGTLYDIGPIHLLSSATLAHLSRRYPAGDFAAARFRPNLLLDSVVAEAPFEENDWIGRTLLVGAEVRLRVIDPCPRCVATTLAQGDLPADPGILRTIAGAGPAVPSRTLIPGALIRAVAGVYADVERPGIVRTGDPVHLE